MMTNEQIREWFNADNHHTDRKIPPLLRLSLAADLIHSLCDPRRDADFHAEHDELFIGGEIVEACVTPEILTRLARLGVHWDSETDCFAMFC
jgi:hypothetical protein